MTIIKATSVDQIDENSSQNACRIMYFMDASASYISFDVNWIRIQFKATGRDAFGFRIIYGYTIGNWLEYALKSDFAIYTNQNSSGLTLSSTTEYEDLVKISSLPAGKYILLGRVQRNSPNVDSSILTWVSITVGNEGPTTGYANCATICGGTAYPMANINRFVQLSSTSDIFIKIKSSNKDHSYVGMLQAFRIG